MTIHKRARLTPIQPREIFDKYFNKGVRICDLQRQYSVSRPTIYRVLEKEESPFTKPEHLFVAIDDFSRELYAAILPDKTQYSATNFLKQVLIEQRFTKVKNPRTNGKAERVIRTLLDMWYRKTELII